MIRFINPSKIQLITTSKNHRMRACDVRKKTGADVVINGTLFSWSIWQPVCVVKAYGKMLSTSKDIYRGLAWNNTDSDFTVTPSDKIADWSNFISCVFMAYQGKPLAMYPSPDVARRAARTAIFKTVSGRLGLWADKQPLTPWELQEELMSREDIDWALMLDGGGSTQLSQAGKHYVYSSRKVQNYLCFWESPERDNEPKGEKPMVEINAYSKKNDGNKHLTSHFKVKEFACKDGSDAVLVAPRLAMILESIRTHFGKPVIINSGYRTPQYNAKVGGAEYSQHCYGTAADIAIRGVNPDNVAEYARSIMPDWGGIGIYREFTHIDVREGRTDWKG